MAQLIINKDLIDVQDVPSHLGVDEALFEQYDKYVEKTNGSYAFKINPGRSYVTANKKIKHPKTSIGNHIVINTNSKNYLVVFSPSIPTMEQTTKGTFYTEKSISLSYEDTDKIQASSKEEFIYMLLHPSCKESPFREKNVAWEYELYMPEKNAILANETARIEIELMGKLYNGDISLLTKTHLLKGFKKLSGDKSEAEINEALYKIFKSDVAKWDKIIRVPSSTTILLEGMVRDGLEKGIISQTNNSNNTVTYEIHSDEILTTIAGADNIDQLINEIIANSGKWIKKISEAIEAHADDKKIAGRAKFSDKETIDAMNSIYGGEKTKVENKKVKKAEVDVLENKEEAEENIKMLDI